MNERIRELAEQAYEQKPLMVVNPQTYELEHKIGNGGVPMYHKVFNQEKFAELIVRECQFAIVSRTDLPRHERKLYNNVLKEHFGVE